jgi:hypothetical protein
MYVETLSMFHGRRVPRVSGFRLLFPLASAPIKPAYRFFHNSVFLVPYDRVVMMKVCDSVLTFNTVSRLHELTHCFHVRFRMTCVNAYHNDPWMRANRISVFAESGLSRNNYASFHGRISHYLIVVFALY